MINQLYILSSFFISGICIGILFDMFRATRKAFKTPNILIYIEDVLFWILTGIILLFTLFTFTNGEIRFYMFLMLILGSFIYFMIISKYIMVFSTHILIVIKTVINYMVLLFKKILKILGKLFNFNKFLKKFSKSSGK